MLTLAVARLAESAASTDSLTGWATVALAVVTVIALATTIFFATAERRRTRAEKDERQRAQARLIITGGVGTTPAAKRDDGYHTRWTLQFTNRSERPVLDVYFEAWTGADPLGQPPRYGMYDKIVMPGPNEPWTLNLITDTPDVHLAAYRYRWTDADGRQWCVDQLTQREPRLFEEGQPPRRYAADLGPQPSSSGSRRHQVTMWWRKARKLHAGSRQP